MLAHEMPVQRQGVSSLSFQSEKQYHRRHPMANFKVRRESPSEVRETPEWRQKLKIEQTKKKNGHPPHDLLGSVLTRPNQKTPC